MMSQIYNAIVVDVYSNQHSTRGYEVHIMILHDIQSTIDTKKQFRNPAVPVHLHHAISG